MNQKPKLRKSVALWRFVKILLIFFGIPVLLILIVVVANVGRYIDKGREARAISEMAGAQTALTGMLADCGVVRFQDLFEDPSSLIAPTAAETVVLQSDVFYKLLRRGRDAGVGLDTEVRHRLGYAYMLIGTDPWDNRYHFYMGPWDPQRHPGFEKMPFRFHINTSEGETPPDDLPIYIFSAGKNGVLDQAFMDGFDASAPGDDIGYWD